MPWPQTIPNRFPNTACACHCADTKQRTYASIADSVTASYYLLAPCEREHRLHNHPSLLARLQGTVHIPIKCWRNRVLMLPRIPTSHLFTLFVPLPWSSTCAACPRPTPRFLRSATQSERSWYLLTYHDAVRAAQRLARDEVDLRHRRLRMRVQQLRHMPYDYAALCCATSEDAWHVDKHHNRNK